MKNALDVKENNEHALDFDLHLSTICQDLHRTFSEICTKFDAVPSSHPLQNRMRPDTQLQRMDVKISESTQLREIWYTDFQHMLVLSSTVA
jgi:hypothetical protein